MGFEFSVRTVPRRTISHTGEAVGFLSANNVYPDNNKVCRRRL